MTPEELGRLFPITLSEHNPDWAEQYRKEATAIQKALPKGCIHRCEHIGSTAIPGIKAKPTIDILLQIHRNSDTEKIIIKIQALGYEYIPKPENPPPHALFVKGYTTKGFSGQAFHIHLRFPGDWDEPQFRDYLIGHPEQAGEYERLKIHLTEKHRYNREDYTTGKTEFVGKIMTLAEQEQDKA